MLSEVLEVGALGMSNGLFTSPGLYVEPDEIRVLGRMSYTVHDAVTEAIDIGERCGIHVQIAI